LLRREPCGFIAPRCQSLGSPCFGLLPPFPRGFFGLGRSQRREHPSKLFPSPAAVSLLSLLGEPALLPLSVVFADPGIFASVEGAGGLATFRFPLRLLAPTSSGFRVLSHRSSPLRRLGVSASPCTLLPWVSFSVRRFDSLTWFRVRIVQTPCGADLSGLFLMLISFTSMKVFASGASTFGLGLPGGRPPGGSHVMTRLPLLLGFIDWESSGASHWFLAGSRKASFRASPLVVRHLSSGAVARSRG
jgi:hypothetical protein